jgi:hypothetical protein
MPPKPTVTQTRLNDIVNCLAATADTLEIISHTLHTPFLGAISVTTRSLLTSVQVRFRIELLQICDLEHQTGYQTEQERVHAVDGADLRAPLCNHRGPSQLGYRRSITTK